VVAGCSLNLRDVRLLRESGWKIPAEEAEDSMVRVYDTRAEPGWLATVAGKSGGPALVWLKARAEHDARAPAGPTTSSAPRPTMEEIRGLRGWPTG